MKISIVTSYYNRKQQFINTLKSIEESVHKDVEVIVVDDCSVEEHRLEGLVDEFPFLVNTSSELPSEIQKMIDSNLGLGIQILESMRKHGCPHLVNTGTFWSYSSVGEQGAFTGTLTGKIDDAVSKMSELGSNSLGSQDQGFSTIRKEYSKFYNFIKGGNDGLSSMRRETMFINILQGLHPLEAEILCLVKDKKLETKYKITKEIVSQAYPEIKWGGRS